MLLISVFFSWYTATASVTLPGGVTISRSASGSGWDSGGGAKLVFLLALVILVVWAIDLFADNVDLPLPGLDGGAGARRRRVAGGRDQVLLEARQRCHRHSAARCHFSVSVAWGLYVAILASIAVVVGAYLHMNETSS